MTNKQTIDGFQLLPCPLCGKEARHVPADYVDGNGSPWPFAECDPCSVGAPVEFWNKRAAQPQGEIVSAKVSAYTPGMGLVEVRLSGGIPSWLELGESVTITPGLPQPQGEVEPVARLEVSADRNAALTVTNEDWLRMLKSQGVHQVVQLYAGQPAPLADEAAKAFAKGFNTLESGGGKYRINMQFQSREDAWGAFNVLARLKQLNTPQ
jgi:hypothetical protein